MLSERGQRVAMQQFGTDWNSADRFNRCGNNRKPRPLEATGVFELEELKFEINIRRC
jgi:hypothetical protein